MTTTITTTENHDLKVGDVITFYVDDTRWFIRLWCWITFKQLPKKLVEQRITSFVTSTRFTI
jgi:hypothetical protein